ncbi:MAG: arginase family protein, partial [Fimbriimonadaceae bacterium]
MDLIGVPFDYCGYRPGSRLGPAALRLAELDVTARDLGLDFRDHGDVSVPHASQGQRSLKQFAPLMQTLRRLMSEVDSSLSNQRIPLVVGGD